MTRSRLARSILALATAGALTLSFAAPAAAAPRDDDRRASPLAALWHALSALWSDLGGRPAERPATPEGPLSYPAAEEGGPEMDPNGLNGAPSGGDGHPEMDPNGANTPNAEGDGGPEWDPDG